MIDLRPDQLEMVTAILKEHAPGCEVWAFGSRVKGTAKNFSDLDLALQSGRPLTFSFLGRLQEAFSESDLAIKVDVVDFNGASPEFQEVIRAHRALIETQTRFNREGLWPGRLNSRS